MQIIIRKEEGYDLALYGLSLSYKDRSILTPYWWDFSNNKEENEKYQKISKKAGSLASLGHGHNKFLRQIMLWVDIEAPRFWWSEFDTYKVGTVAQSESSMHTLSKRDLRITDFDWDRGNISMIAHYYKIIEIFNQARKEKAGLEELKMLLPESYLQRRLVTMNYEILCNIIKQRKNHKLSQWKFFIEKIYQQIGHRELLPEYPYKDECMEVFYE